MRGTTGLAMVLTLLALLGTAAEAGVEPSPFINFQGVLRDASGHPLDGDFAMTFSFFSAGTGGEEILVDRHLGVFTPMVHVSGGQFSAVLGGGSVSDGSGPGVYLDLSDVFRDYASVHLEVQIDGEILFPRSKIQSTAYSLNSSHLGGKGPGEFLDTSTTAQTKYAQLRTDASAIPGSFGLWGAGPAAGGFFQDSDGSGYGYVGYGDNGVAAWGNAAGGYFNDSTNSGYAYVGTGDYGIRGYGNTAGALFEDLNSSGYAYVGYSDYGIRGYGNTAGARFDDRDGSGYAYIGYGDYGIDARGDTAGGYFEDLNHSGYATVAVGEYGITAHGNNAGGYFQDDNSTAWAYVGYSSYKIQGIGSVAFVQNHPYDEGKVIVYNSPEGDEVAVYTRGSARLANGEARVRLGETFAWVTDPDVGLTAYAVPREECRGLLVASVSPEELVVRELGGGTSDAAFDYIVYGLRIGFEETAVVQEKQEEAPIPAMTEHRQLYARRPDLRAYSALERFTAMETANGRGGRVDRSRAEALKAAIQEYDPAAGGTVPERPDPGAGAARLGRASVPGTPGPSPADSSRGTSPDGIERDEPASSRSVAQHDAATSGASVVVPSDCAADLFAVGETVQEGDVLVLDLRRPGALLKASFPGDALVVGVATGESIPDGEELRVPVAASGFAVVKVDASYGAVAPGDFLVASATPGHAMRDAAPAPGTVIGKALEALESGTGLVRAVLTPR